MHRPIRKCLGGGVTNGEDTRDSAKQQPDNGDHGSLPDYCSRYFQY